MDLSQSPGNAGGAGGHGTGEVVVQDPATSSSIESL